MTIRDLIQRLEGLENQDREIDFYVDEYNDNTEDFDSAEITFMCDEIEGDFIEMYFTKMHTHLSQD